jgi:hypothetical protein
VKAKDGELSELRLSHSFAAEASKQGARYPAELWKLADRDDIDVDDGGNAKNLPKVVEGLKNRFPEMFGKVRPSGSADGGARGGAGGSRDDVRPGIGRLRGVDRTATSKTG